MNCVDKGKNFLKDFELYRYGSARRMQNKMAKYYKQRMDFLAPRAVKAWITAIEPAIEYKETLRMSVVLRFIWKYPGFPDGWKVECVQCVIKDGETVIFNGIKGLTLGYPYSDLIGSVDGALLK